MSEADFPPLPLADTRLYPAGCYFADDMRAYVLADRAARMAAATRDEIDSLTGINAAASASTTGETP